MSKVTEIPVYCWHCGKQFYIEISNVCAGRLFCSDECRIANIEQEKNILNNRKKEEKSDEN